MQNLTLQQMFGVGATQNATVLTINKADLVGLTTSATNTAESLLAAILLQAWGQFEGTLTNQQGNTITDEQGRAITYDNHGLYEKIHLWFWKRQFIEQRGFPEILDTFVIELFLAPQSPLTADSFNYL